MTAVKRVAAVGWLLFVTILLTLIFPRVMADLWTTLGRARREGRLWQALCRAAEVDHPDDDGWVMLSAEEAARPRCERCATRPGTRETYRADGERVRIERVCEVCSPTPW
jgi:hypothetical protein